MGDVIKLRRKQVEIQVEDEGGTIRTYVVRSLLGGDRDLWVEKLSAKTEFSDEGKPRVKSMVGIREALLSKCLFDDQGKAVSEATVAGWPSEAVDALFTKAQEVSGLTEAAASNLGNG